MSPSSLPMLTNPGSALEHKNLLQPPGVCVVSAFSLKNLLQMSGIENVD